MILLRTEAPEQLASLRRVVGLSRGERKRYRRASIRGNHMNLGGPSATGLADRLGSFFLGIIYKGPRKRLTFFGTFL